MTRVLGLAAGGHSRVVIEALRAAGSWDIVGLLDPREELWGSLVLGVPVLGDDTLLPEQRAQGIERAFVGLGGTGDTEPRRLLYERVRSEGFEPVSVVHPAAVVSDSASLGDGHTVLAAAVVGTGVRLGQNVLVNTGAIIDHDCVIGAHAHIATGARLASGVHVGAGAHVGLGASVRQGARIGEGALVGAGAVVVADVEPGTVVAGVPASALERREA